MRSPWRYFQRWHPVEPEVKSSFRSVMISGIPAAVRGEVLMALVGCRGRAPTWWAAGVTGRSRTRFGEVRHPYLAVSEMVTPSIRASAGGVSAGLTVRRARRAT